MGAGFALDDHAFLAVVGPSGAGKSTLLNALTGFRQAPRGTVLARIHRGRKVLALSLIEAGAAGRTSQAAGGGQ